MRRLVMLAVTVVSILAVTYGSSSEVRQIVKVSSLEATELNQANVVRGERTTELGKASTKALKMLESVDGKFRAGVFESGPARLTVASYKNDEFMYFLKGELTFRSDDGVEIRAEAGDAITLPRGWKGVLETSGYTKYFVAYTDK